jgi:hypothetical protein
MVGGSASSAHLTCFFFSFFKRTTQLLQPPILLHFDQKLLLATTPHFCWATSVNVFTDFLFLSLICFEQEEVIMEWLGEIPE